MRAEKIGTFESYVPDDHKYKYIGAQHFIEATTGLDWYDMQMDITNAESDADVVYIRVSDWGLVTQATVDHTELFFTPGNRTLWKVYTKKSPKDLILKNFDGKKFTESKPLIDAVSAFGAKMALSRRGRYKGLHDGVCEVGYEPLTMFIDHAAIWQISSPYVSAIQHILAYSDENMADFFREANDHS